MKGKIWQQMKCDLDRNRTKYEYITTYICFFVIYEMWKYRKGDKNINFIGMHVTNYDT